MRDTLSFPFRRAAAVAVSMLEELGGWGQMLGDAVRQVFHRPFESSLLVRQMEHLGFRSLSITMLTALFTGMVLALQISVALDRFGVKAYIGEIVAIALVRELGPVLTALLVGGRVGAGITAELGSMAVTEQIDALRALGSSPVKKLVVPRVLALLIMLPLLTVLANFVGIMGGLLVAVFELHLTTHFYTTRVMEALTFSDLISGIGKTFFFAAAIASIGCYNGMTARGGADGVGHATTQTVVAASVTVLISNFFLTKMFMLVF
jgi:phospholipid/cholesterol/gamma-HCH transport system permease protein